MRVLYDYVPQGAVNRPGLSLRGGRPTFVTVHETGNNRAGMGARAHRDFLHNGGGEHHVSFHFAVDAHEAYGLIPVTERAWHAGDGADGPGNATAIAVEHCVPEDQDWMAMAHNGIALVAALCFVWGIPHGRVVPHSYWRKTECPAWLTGTGMLDWYIERVRQQIAALAR